MRGTIWSAVGVRPCRGVCELWNSMSYLYGLILDEISKTHRKEPQHALRPDGVLDEGPHRQVHLFCVWLWVVRSIPTASTFVMLLHHTQINPKHNPKTNTHTY